MYFPYDWYTFATNTVSPYSTHYYFSTELHPSSALWRSREWACPTMFRDSGSWRYLIRRRLAFVSPKQVQCTYKHTRSYNPDLSSFRPHLTGVPALGVTQPTLFWGKHKHFLPFALRERKLARTLATDTELGNWEYEVHGHLLTRRPIFRLAARHWRQVTSWGCEVTQPLPTWLAQIEHSDISV